MPGCYGQTGKIAVRDTDVAAYLMESALFASSENKLEVGAVLNSPAFFPFEFPAYSGSTLMSANSRLEVQRFASGEEIVGFSNNDKSSL